MTQTNYRREFWQNVYTAHISLNWSPVDCADFADKAVKALDERFPETVKSYTPIKELANETISVEYKYLKSLVDQYSAQLADYRKAGPAKDIEIERLTREGLIKDQRIDSLEKRLDFEKGNAEKRISNLCRMVDGQVKTIAEKDQRIAELLDINKTAVARFEAAEKRISESPTHIEIRVRKAYEERIKELCRAMDRRDQRIAELETLNASIESQMKRAFAEVCERDGKIKELNREKARDNQYIEAHMERIAELENRIENLIAPESVAYAENTAAFWLNKLPEPYRSQALANAEKQKYLGAERTDLAGAVNSFTWSRTPEGDSYWLKVYDHFYHAAEASENVPPLPDAL